MINLFSISDVFFYICITINNRINIVLNITCTIIIAIIFIVVKLLIFVIAIAKIVTL